MNEVKAPNTVSSAALYQALVKRHRGDGCECDNCSYERTKLARELKHREIEDSCPERASKYLAEKEKPKHVESTRNGMTQIEAYYASVLGPWFRDNEGSEL